MTQPAPIPDSPPPSADPMRVPPPASRPVIGDPREWNIVARYLSDQSLRYAKLRIGSTSLPRAISFFFFSALSCAAVIVPLWRLIAHRTFPLDSLVLIPGLLACVLLVRPMLTALRDARSRWFWRAMGSVGLGLDRAVFQPGNSFRYEVHLPASRALELHEARIRLVFWESWTERIPIPWLRIHRRAHRKQGHDLVTQSAFALSIQKGQHGVVRGEIRVPMSRPTEHHRGKRKHVSYVNLTITLIASEKGRTTRFSGDWPHLITFPWM